jgi:hypothetical protein
MGSWGVSGRAVGNKGVATRAMVVVTLGSNGDCLGGSPVIVVW